MSDLIDPYAIAKRLLSFSDEWADKKAAADLLAELKKPLLSELSLECNEASQSAKESYALRHDNFKEHVRSMVEAERVSNRAKGKLEAERVRIDLLRTKAASERFINQNS